MMPSLIKYQEEELAVDLEHIPMSALVHSQNTAPGEMKTHYIDIVDT